MQNANLIIQGEIMTSHILSLQNDKFIFTLLPAGKVRNSNENYAYPSGLPIFHS